ncbi:MAG: phage integrase family protein [Dehalococcoidia bacterium]|nr:MAG: phage integrase family protein [Dehalococcoidia bacterium]
MKNVRLPQRIVQPFSPEEVARILDACGDGEIGLRDRALIMLLLDTGARCSEVIQLTLTEVDVENGRIRILHGKGNKQRVVPFARACQATIEAYLAVRGREPGALFWTTDGHGAIRPGAPLRIHGLQQVMRRLGSRAGVTKVHAHRFRHTFATWAIQHDARELDVQYLLGHSSPDMVRRYSSSYRSEQAALRHAAFSPADQMLVATTR